MDNDNIVTEPQYIKRGSQDQVGDIDKHDMFISHAGHVALEFRAVEITPVERSSVERLIDGLSGSVDVSYVPRFKSGIWCPQNERSVPLIMGRKMTVPALQFLVDQARDLRFSLYKVKRERTLLVKAGTLMELLEFCGWQLFAQNQRGLFQMMWERVRGVGTLSFIGSLLSPYVPMTSVPQKMEIKVYFECTGPTVYDVLTYEGTGHGEEITAGADVYVVCKESLMPRQQLHVPSSVKWIWLRHHAIASFSDARLGDAEYYDYALDDYSLWSFPLHQAQIKMILSMLPPDTVVIAPGDGIGVVARSWAGIYTSGDKSVGKLSHSSVVQEDMIETITRGMNLPGKKVIVLSYCSKWLDDAAVTSILRLNVPIFVLEAHNTFTWRCPVKKLGPGLFVAYAEHIHLQVPVLGFSVERAVQRVGVPYSENLLNLESPIFTESSVWLDYYAAMRPLACIQVSKNYSGVRPLMSVEADNPDSVYVVSTIDSLVKQHKLDAGKSYYLAPIGRIAECQRHLSDPVPLRCTLQTRCVYVLNSGGEWHDVLRSKVLMSEPDKAGYVYAVYQWHLNKETSMDVMLQSAASLSHIRIDWTNEPIPVTSEISAFWRSGKSVYVRVRKQVFGPFVVRHPSVDDTKLCPMILAYQMEQRGVEERVFMEFCLDYGLEGEDIRLPGGRFETMIVEQYNACWNNPLMIASTFSRTFTQAEDLDDGEDPGDYC
jgi:hypothetical protein